MSLFGPINTGVAAGGAGTATANADTNIPLTGFIIGVYVRYNGSPPAGTTDVVIKTKGTKAPSLTVLTLTNSATDGWRWPRLLTQDAAGVDITGGYEEVMIDDIVNVSIAQANNGNSADVWLMLW